MREGIAFSHYFLLVKGVVAGLVEQGLNLNILTLQLLDFIQSGSVYLGTLDGLEFFLHRIVARFCPTVLVNTQYKKAKNKQHKQNEYKYGVAF